MGHAIRIDRQGGTTETVADGLSESRAYELALAIRSRVRPGETLWIGDADGFDVIHRA